MSVSHRPLRLSIYGAPIVLSAVILVFYPSQPHSHRETGTVTVGMLVWRLLRSIKNCISQHIFQLFDFRLADFFWLILRPAFLSHVQKTKRRFNTKTQKAYEKLNSSLFSSLSKITLVMCDVSLQCFAVMMMYRKRGPLTEIMFIFQRLCDYVCDLLLEESNVQPVSTPVTVCGDIHGQVSTTGFLFSFVLQKILRSSLDTEITDIQSLPFSCFLKCKKKKNLCIQECSSRKKDKSTYL